MAGFLGLEDLTNSRGELALVVQTDKKNFSIEAVASLPDTSISSVQDAYLCYDKALWAAVSPVLRSLSSASVSLAPKTSCDGLLFYCFVILLSQLALGMVLECSAYSVTLLFSRTDHFILVYIVGSVRQ